MSPNPDQDTGCGKPEYAARIKLKRSPSSRISNLVSRFEPAPSDGTKAHTGLITSSEIPSLLRPTLEHSLSKVGGAGRVERNVRRFSTGTRANIGKPERACSVDSSTISVDPVVHASVPCTANNPNSRTILDAIPVPPPIAARFRHAVPLTRDTPTTITVAQRPLGAAADTWEVVSASRKSDSRVKGAVTPARNSSFGTITSLAPSFATSEATAVEKSDKRLSPATEKGSLNVLDFLDTPDRPSGGQSPDSWAVLGALQHAYPAYRVFARDAAPLHLPDLDKLLETLGQCPDFPQPPVMRTDAVGSGTSLERMQTSKNGGSSEFGSEEERTSWNEWVRGEPVSIWRRCTERFMEHSKREDVTEWLIGGERTALTKEQYLQSLIFPPFHRLAPNATLTDLKSNIRKAPPLFSGNTVLQIAADGALNVFGSAAGIKLTTVEGLRDLLQMATLLSTSASSPSLTASTVYASQKHDPMAHNSTFLMKLPSLLALDLASAFGRAILFLGVTALLALLSLHEFYRFSGRWRGIALKPRGRRDVADSEGYDREDLRVRKPTIRNRRCWKIAVTFFLTTIYLPLSKLALSALFWERGYWTSELLGTDPRDDRCYSTGGGRFNLAIIILPLALLVIALLGCWFPIRMYQLIKGAKPSVDKWTELGEVRRDKKGEYERLLDKDPSPFSFLYREYRSEWATFRSIYMLVKLFNVFIIVLISSDNCVFAAFNESRLAIIRQGTLFAFMTCFFLLDVYSRPQLDEISNRSDRISRLAYVLISLCGLLVALRVPGQGFFDGSAIIVINVFSYSFNVYFALIGTQVFRKAVKRIQRRLDFSIDIFSPNLDLSKHISRRIWQETFSTLFLTAPEFAMEPQTQLAYCGSPPYLLNFRGSVAERHLENLQILREIGLDAYCEGIIWDRCPRLTELRRVLHWEVAGPDVFYQPCPTEVSPTIKTFFGRLDIVPFPFMAVFIYDEEPSAPLNLSSIEQLEVLVQQQELAHVKVARKIRLALRALENQIIYLPHRETRIVQQKDAFLHHYEIAYKLARIHIKRNSSFVWQGYNSSSGFDVTLEWQDGTGIGKAGSLQSDLKLTLPGSQCGILPDFSLTRPLALLLKHNRHIVEEQLPLVEDALKRHRHYFAEEAETKRRILSYQSLLTVYAADEMSMKELEASLRVSEQNEKIRNIFQQHRTTFNSLEKRMELVTSSKVRAWWFVVFDDLYRRNTGFHSEPEHFSPHYSSSICYRPMPRAQFEAFLSERGFSTTKARAFFSPGLLNQIYFVLDEMAFSSMEDHSIPIHLASNPEEPIRYSSLPRKLVPPLPPPNEPSTPDTLSRLTAGTGDGTNEDDRYIRARRGFLFEEAYDRPRPQFVEGQRRAAIQYFLGVRVPRGVKRWLGWTLNETDHRLEQEVRLELKKGHWSA